MIPKKFINDFLKEPRDDHRWLKDLSEKDLDEAIRRMRPKVSIFDKARLSQKVGFYLGVAYPRFSFFYEMGCVDGDTEYLSPNGWQFMRDYDGGLVAQYNPEDQSAAFVKPSDYIVRPCQTMYHFKSARGCDQMLSAEHRVLAVLNMEPDKVKGPKLSVKPVSPVFKYASSGNPSPWFCEMSAEQLFTTAEKRAIRFDTTFLMDGPGISLSDAELRVQIAVHADGYLFPRKRKAKVAINIKKRRKKARLARLLRDANIPYVIHKSAPGYARFVFVPPIASKTYSSDWYRCSFRQKRIICDEVVHWDGSVQSGSRGGLFFTRSKGCANFIQFCFSSIGKRASLCGYARDDGKVDYVVGVVGSGRSTNLAHFRNGKKVPAPGGLKYCFSVPTGFLVFRRNGNVFVSGNTGKTLIALELLRYWFLCGQTNRALIFVTSNKAFNTWEEQIKRFDIDLPYVMLDGPSELKWQTLADFDRGLVIVSYPGAVAMVSNIIKSKGKTKWELDKRKTAKLLGGSNAIVFDEVTKASGDSLTNLMCRRLSRQVDICYGLAGRPLGRDPTLLWRCQRLIDQGESLGETLELFRAAFFSEEQNRWGNKWSKNYKFKKSMMPQLKRMSQHRALYYASEECVDLPKLVPVIDKVVLPEEAGQYYRKVIANIIEARGNLREMKNAFVRMRQLSSGFLGFRDDETDDRAEISFKDNPKFDRLMELLDNLPEGHKAVVFYEFTWSGRRIYEALTKRGQRAIWLWSGTKDPMGDERKFKTDPKCEVCVLNNRVGAYSLDGLQKVANYVMYYESPVSPIDRAQADMRVRRPGQELTVFQYDLVVDGTMDERILQFHKEGNDILYALRSNPEKLFAPI